MKLKNLFWLKRVGQPSGMLPMRQRIQLYRHLAGQLRNGIATTQSLLLFSRRGDPEGKRADSRLLDVMRRLQDGKSLGAAFHGVLPQDEVLLLEYGEAGGNLPSILELLQESRQQQLMVQRTLREATTAPLVYLVSTLVMLWVMGAKVLPTLQTVLPASRAQGLVAMLYSLGALSQSPWVLGLVFLTLVVLAMLLYQSLPRWRGVGRLKAERFFPYSLYRDLQGYAWLTGFSTLLSSGVHDLQILRQQKTRANPWLKERLSHLIINLENGKTLGAALQSKGPHHGLPFYFPNPEVVAEMVSMDGHRDFAHRLADLRARWADELNHQMQNISRRFGFWLEMVLFGCMGFLMVAINQLSLQVGNIRY
jgi:type II secretory pathway component PulF